MKETKRLLALFAGLLLCVVAVFLLWLPPLSFAQPAAALPSFFAQQEDLLNLNTATQAELRVLPQIGERRAEAIVAYRTEHGPFATIEDVQNVPGISTKIFAAIQPYLIVK